MRLHTLTALALALMAVLAFVAGCSDDDAATTPAITYGDNDDPVFVPVQTQIDGVLDEMIGDFAAGMGNLYTNPGDTASIRAELIPPWMVPNPDEEPVDTLITGYQNEWHFVYASYLGDAYRSVFCDSIQFRIDGEAVETPTNDVDYIHNIANWAITCLNQNVSHLDLNGRSDYEFAALDQAVATVDGDGHHMVEITYVSADTSYFGNYNFNMTVAGVQVAKSPTGWNNACPVAGTITMTMSYVYAWTGPQSSGNGASSWTVTASFDQGTATVTASNGASTWQYVSDVCSPAQP